MDFATFLVRTIADIFYNKPAKHETKDIYQELKGKINGNNISQVTQKVLKEMFCENTGSHICDSGGAYGYGYQRAQAIKDQNWMEFPSVTVEVDKYSKGEYYANITKNSYQFLCEHLSYNVKMDEIFHKFCNSESTFQVKEYRTRVIKEEGKNGKTIYKNKNEQYTSYFVPQKESYYTCMKYFVKILQQSPDFEEFSKYSLDLQDLGVYNTYNGDSCLDKTLQWEMFKINNGKFEGTYVILEIHNGCDVRGGYSTPHVFTIDEDEFLCNIDSLSCRCKNWGENYEKKTSKQLDLRGNTVPDPKHTDAYSDDCGYHWYSDDGSDKWEYITNEEGEHKIVCPLCKEELEFYSY